MRKVDKLILRAVLPPVILSGVVLTFVVFMRELGRLSELLVTLNASPEVIGMLMGAILPASSAILHTVKETITLRQPTSQIQPRVFNEEFSNVVFYLDDIALDRQRWARVFLADNSNPKSPRVILARDGAWVTDQDAYRLQFHLEDGTIYEANPDDPGKDNVSLFVATDIPVDLNHGGPPHPAESGYGRPKRPIEQTTL